MVPDPLAHSVTENTRRASVSPLQAFLAASLKTDGELLEWFRQRLVWNDPEVVKTLVKNGLFYRIYTPQVRLPSLALRPSCCFERMHSCSGWCRSAHELWHQHRRTRCCLLVQQRDGERSHHTRRASRRVEVLKSVDAALQVLIRGFLALNEREAAAAVGPAGGRADLTGSSVGGASLVGAALAQQVPSLIQHLDHFCKPEQVPSLIQHPDCSQKKGACCRTRAAAGTTAVAVRPDVARALDVLLLWRGCGGESSGPALGAQCICVSESACTRNALLEWVCWDACSEPSLPSQAPQRGAAPLADALRESRRGRKRAAHARQGVGAAGAVVRPLQDSPQQPGSEQRPQRHAGEGPRQRGQGGLGQRTVGGPQQRQDQEGADGKGAALEVDRLAALRPLAPAELLPVADAVAAAAARQGVQLGRQGGSRGAGGAGDAEQLAARGDSSLGGAGRNSSSAEGGAADGSSLARAAASGSSNSAAGYTLNPNMAGIAKRKGSLALGVTAAVKHSGSALVAGQNAAAGGGSDRYGGGQAAVSNDGIEAVTAGGGGGRGRHGGAASGRAGAAASGSGGSSEHAGVAASADGGSASAALLPEAPLTALELASDLQTRSIAKSEQRQSDSGDGAVLPGAAGDASSAAAADMLTKP